MKLIHEDENWLYFEGEIEVEGKKYIQRLTQAKMCEKTDLPMHLSKQRVRWSNEDEQVMRKPV